MSNRCNAHPSKAEQERSETGRKHGDRESQPTDGGHAEVCKSWGEVAGEGPDPTGTTRETPPTPLVQLGCGLGTRPKKLLERIEIEEYVDFNELPPVKGTGRSMAQAVDGQVVVVVVAPDLMQSRRLIPDLATWLQCFGLFTAAVARSKPERVPDLMAYMTIIARASQKYRWPACVIYDQNFRLKVAGNAAQSWARVDPSIYAQPLLTYPILATLLIGHIQLSWMEVGPD